MPKKKGKKKAAAAPAPAAAAEPVAEKEEPVEEDEEEVKKSKLDMEKDKGLDKVTDYVEEKALDENKMKQALTTLGEVDKAEAAAKAER